MPDESIESFMLRQQPLCVACRPLAPTADEYAEQRRKFAEALEESGPGSLRAHYESEIEKYPSWF